MTTLPPTPWRVREQGDANQYCILGADGRWVIGLILNGEMLLERQRAVLDRVVECVHALDGVDTQAIAEMPNGKVSGLLAQVYKFRDQVRDTCQRAEKAEARDAEALATIRDLYNTMEVPRTRRATEAWQRAARFIAKREV